MHNDEKMSDEKISLENILLDVTITIMDKEKEEKAGQLRYHESEGVSEVEIFDTYLFPEYRRKKIMSSLLQKITSQLKVSGRSKIILKYFDDDARIAWEKMGFVAIDDNHMELYLTNGDTKNEGIEY